MNVTLSLKAKDGATSTLVVPVTIAPPKSKNPILAMAAVGPPYVTGWDAAQKDLGGGITMMRAYQTPNQIPATWAATNAGAVYAGATTTRPTKFVLSLKPALDGSQVAAVVTLAKSIEAAIKQYGIEVIVCFQHEPENKDKGITPAAFTSCWMQYAEAFAANAPSVEFAAIFMTFTSNGRKPDADGHTTAGHNEWLEALVAALKAQNLLHLLNYVMWDGYYKLGGANQISVATIFDQPIALAESLVPGIKQGVAEWGILQGTANISTILGQFYKDFQSRNLYCIAYFNLDTGGNYQLIDAPSQKVFASFPRD